MEKREKPTPNKMLQARKRGEVAFSPALQHALILFFSFLLLRYLIPRFVSAWKEVFERSIPEIGGIEHIPLYLYPPLVSLVSLCVIGFFLVACGGFLLQRGWIWSRARDRHQRRSTPLLYVLQVGGIFGIWWYRITPPSLLPATRGGPSQEIIWIGETLYSLAWQIAALSLVGGIGDYIYQKWRHYKNMYMTPEEIREEQQGRERRKGRVTRHTSGT
jgi:flagellar biosynthetic protein FlhB